MEDLLLATVALLAFAIAAVVHGRRKKQSFVALVQDRPELVERLYLRPAETGAYWLHVKLTDGRKARIAAPWELDEALAGLAERGLRLGHEDRQALADFRDGRPTARPA
ncbi:MAG: hypothetical protein KDH15_01160 [Rhodocyclaceae bacterium]|nr:hypothetical protein [Rhodocyclaceae bacterium]